MSQTNWEADKMQVLPGAAGAMSPQVQARSQQLPGTPDIKSEMNPVLTPRTTGSDGSLIGIPGTGPTAVWDTTTAKAFYTVSSALSPTSDVDATAPAPAPAPAAAHACSAESDITSWQR